MKDVAHKWVDVFPTELGVIWIISPCKFRGYATTRSPFVKMSERFCQPSSKQNQEPISFAEFVAGGNRKMFRVSRVVAHFFIRFFWFGQDFPPFFWLLLQNRDCLLWKVRKLKGRPDKCPWFSTVWFLEFRDTSQNSLWFCTGKTVKGLNPHKNGQSRATKSNQHTWQTSCGGSWNHQEIQRSICF